MLLFIIMFSGVVATYVFSGLLMFAGMVALCESIPLVRWLFSKTGNLLDLLIFGFSVFAIADMGVTVAIGLSVAGLLFSVYYKPLLKKSHRKRSKNVSGNAKGRESRTYRSALWMQ